MVASIEALYIVLDYSETERRQSPISLDTYFLSICSFQRVQLEKTVNSRTISVDRMVMIDELSH